MLEPDLIASVGEPGTVISCDGFPPNVTLADVSQFFNQFSLVESSVKIKLDDRGMPTGECLLSLGSVEVFIILLPVLFIIIFSYIYLCENFIISIVLGSEKGSFDVKWSKIKWFCCNSDSCSSKTVINFYIAD